jgi:hypothetical protein
VDGGAAAFGPSRLPFSARYGFAIRLRPKVSVPERSGGTTLDGPDDHTVRAEGESQL